MRIIETQVWPEQQHPPFGAGIYIALEGEELVAGLTEGERVILRESPDSEVDATMHLVLLSGRKVWFGELTSEYRDLTDIPDIPDISDNPAESPSAATSQE